SPCRDADRRDFNSFPTRRSSDLLMVVLNAELCLGHDNHAGLQRQAEPFESLTRCAQAHRSSPERKKAPCGAFFLTGGDGGIRLRSEEHTSELQSRENLVCRLLLE